MAGQLVFPFGVRPAQSRDDFIVAPCNESAFQFIQRWPDWPARMAALYGPPRCGKSHLARIWCTLSGAQEVTVQAFEHAIEVLPAEGAVLLEDIDATPYALLDRDRLLMTLFERPAVSVLLTARTPPTQWPAIIGDLRSRFDALLSFPMWTPDDGLLTSLARKHFHDRQLAVPDTVIQRILRHIERTPEAIAAFVARVDAKALSQKRAVTERLIADVIDTEKPG